MTKPLAITEQLPPERLPCGIIIVDHGSRRAESNDLLLEVVSAFRHQHVCPIVEPAHMELAEPSIASAFDTCVSLGAKTVVIFPYFLLPGRHWDEDIPRLAGEAARRHAGVQFLVTAPLGVHPLMPQIMADRIERCLAHAQGQADSCDLCANTGHCQLAVGGGD